MRLLLALLFAQFLRLDSRYHSLYNHALLAHAPPNSHASEPGQVLLDWQAAEGYCGFNGNTDSKSITKDVCAALKNGSVAVHVQHAALRLTEFDLDNDNTLLLSLPCCQLEPPTVRLLGQLVKRLRGLHTLVLDGNPLGVEVRAVIQGLRRHALTYLSLSGCALDDECVEMVSNLLKSSNITHLDVSMNQITAEGVSLLASKRLRSLDLSYNPIGNDGLAILASLLEEGKLPHLDSLTLRQVGADRQAVERLLQAASGTPLMLLDLSGNEVLVQKKAKKHKLE
eukprot:CAMPEP_0173225332 /NCGR_PEP_ID=MMETSP1142-20121109/4822_1 /TAXON_ID=483371 /ORGANISM="non described non described, Strain CCMP2298" /LENGTH=282 /DNA_ID=CAMNT_0014153671 /DNA_START=149 /DNA_END=994 /DNA_ORIENTATION=-